MGEPVIIWPPGCGNYVGNSCEDLFGAGWTECPGGWSEDTGFGCCPTGE
jgi:hypothetical protein